MIMTDPKDSSKDELDSAHIFASDEKKRGETSDNLAGDTLDSGIGMSNLGLTDGSNEGLLDFPKKTFISYSHHDKPFVERLCLALEQWNIEFWTPESSLRPGEDFVPKMVLALSEADAIVLVISPNALKSDWVLSEWAVVRARLMSKGMPRIFPILIEKTNELPYFLKTIHWIDMTDPTRFDEKVAEIASAILNKITKKDVVSTTTTSTTTTTTCDGSIHVARINAEREMLVEEKNSYARTFLPNRKAILSTVLMLGAITAVFVVFELGIAGDNFLGSCAVFCSGMLVHKLVGALTRE